jgi:protein-S-isoprenylcysteine O-methyltransferase Ste14
MAESFLIILTIAIYGVIHSLLASLEVKGLARGWFGSSADRWYRLAYNLFAAFSFLPVIMLVLLLPDRHLYTIPFPWIILSMAIQFLGVVGIIVGIRQTGLGSFFGLEQLINPHKDASTVLVTTGLYRWVRHPLYTAGLLLIWFTPLMTRNLLFASLGLTLYLLSGAYFEERKLLREFGDIYAEYRRRTPMLILGFHFPSKQSLKR